MYPGMVVRLRPTGPWRAGPDTGARDRVDRIYHSDSLFSAVCGAFRLLGGLEEWLDATARNPEGPAVVFSSCFPYHDEVHFVTPPRSLWPPAASPKVRWKGARFVPLSLVDDLLAERTLSEDAWGVDGASECLLRMDGGQGSVAPYRAGLRSRAGVDRQSGTAVSHSAACIEFAPKAGLWFAVAFAGEEAREHWAEKVRAAFRVLADSGMGGKRSSGWGHSANPEFVDGFLPDMLVRQLPAPVPPEGEAAPAPETAYWLLSLFAPSAADAVDWARGDYTLATRGGRVESPVGWGAPKKLLRMVTEGSVLLAAAPVRGAAHDVAPDGFPHPVYRAGFALAVPIPWRVTA